MNIINFINRFPDEVSCIEFIKEQRIQQGIICKKCSGCKHYWLENKLRVVMGKRDDRYRLEDMVEYDEAFVGKSPKAQVRSKLKRGRGTQKQSKGAVMAESTVSEDPESGKIDKSCRYFKMKKIKNLEAKTAQTLIKEYIDSNSVLQTDKSTTFSDLSDCIDVHVRGISGTDKGKFNLRWVHVGISNLNKHLQTYHMISERMMQNYLDEFCYKLNRRYFGQKLFDRLIIASIYPYWQD